MYRLATRRDTEEPAGDIALGRELFGAGLSGAELARRYGHGERLWVRPVGGGLPDGATALFLVRAGGVLTPVTGPHAPVVRPDDQVIGIGGAAVPAIPKHHE